MRDSSATPGPAPIQIQSPQMEELDALLENEEMVDFEKTAFMDRSKLMLSMIDNMLASIDGRIQHISNSPVKMATAVM